MENKELYTALMKWLFLKAQKKILIMVHIKPLEA